VVTGRSFERRALGAYSVRQSRVSRKTVSRDNLKFTLRNAVCDWLSFTTLTYPGEYPLDGRECKRHFHLFLTHLRQDYVGIKIVWFLEFQERGAPHFHIFTTCAIPGKTYVSPLWYHIVNSGDKRHLEAGTQVRALSTSAEAIKYATSYANKANQKEVPETFTGVGRFWGSSRSLTESIVELEDISILSFSTSVVTGLRASK